MRRARWALLAIAAAPSCSPPSEPLELAPLTGRQIFMARCAACHEPDGRGIPDLCPPLPDSPILHGPPENLLRVVLLGMKGKVVREGKTFTGIMPAWRFDLSDAQIASVVNDLYLRWRPSAPPVTEDQVRDIRRATEGQPLFPPAGTMLPADGAARRS